MKSSQQTKPKGNINEISTPHSTDRSHSTSTSSESNQIDDDARLAMEIAENEAIIDRDCTSDAALAALLQRQFDIDYNKQLDKEQARRNGLSKVGVSLDRFKRDSSQNKFYDPDFIEDDWITDESDEVSVENDNERVVDVFEQSELKQRSRLVGRAGFVLDQDGNMITKHDIPTSSRKNMCKLMESKSDIKTGDGGAQKDNFMLNNYVYNKLKVHSKKSSRRANQREFDKKERENSLILTGDLQAIKLSPATKIIIDGLISNCSIEQLNGVIGHGKESTIFHATGRDIDDVPNQDIAIKIYKSDLNVAFKTRDSYNKSKCPTYKFDKPKSKNDSLNKWAERGYKNLKSMRKANINCPDPILLRKHVLIMSYLGDESSIPSPTLKDATLDTAQLRQSYDQVIEIMRQMYRTCDLIHGDLSEYNLLWHKNQVYVIDVSQSMSSSHPSANRFLYRDCKNILAFYERFNLNDILDVKSLFTDITGKSLDDKDVEFWCKIEDFPCNERIMDKQQQHQMQIGTANEDLDSNDGMPDRVAQILQPTSPLHTNELSASD